VGDVHARDHERVDVVARHHGVEVVGRIGRGRIAAGVADLAVVERHPAGIEVEKRGDPHVGPFGDGAVVHEAAAAGPDEGDVAGGVRGHGWNHLTDLVASGNRLP